MNDLADDEKAAILENLARGVGEIDRALDAVTKTKLLGQPHGQVADRDDPAVAPDLFDDVAAVMRLDLFLHCRHDLRGAEVDFVARSGAAGDEVRAHGDRLCGRWAPFSSAQRSAEICRPIFVALSRQSGADPAGP